MAQFLFYHIVLVGIVASPCQSDLTLPNALAPTIILVGAFLFKIENLVFRASLWMIYDCRLEIAD
jgi:hypothetical protein